MVQACSPGPSPINGSVRRPDQSCISVRASATVPVRPPQPASAPYVHGWTGPRVTDHTCAAASPRLASVYCPLPRSLASGCEGAPAAASLVFDVCPMPVRSCSVCDCASCVYSGQWTDYWAAAGGSPLHVPRVTPVRGGRL